MHPRRSQRVFAFLALGLGLFLLTFADAALQRAEHNATVAANRQLVAQLGLTDLSLFTEARYTRHPSQADLHSAFQDHPLALEHFPSGALLSPPQHLLSRHEDLDRKTDRAD
jgi:hypothetical protein